MNDSWNYDAHVNNTNSDSPPPPVLLLQISSMLLFVKKYKQEVLGVGEVALPGEGRALGEAAVQRTAKEAKDSGNKKDTAPAASSTNGTDEGTKTEYVCKVWWSL